NLSRGAPLAPPQIFHNSPENSIKIFSRTESNSLSSASALATTQPPLDPVKNRSDYQQHDRQSSYHLLTGEGTPSTTGWFEVEVNNKLVHSKKNGDGFVDSDSKFKAVVTAIEQAMGK
uniref:Uncharacterized protein n=1 Tax=Sinocyclocheilus rhinocerous TaxID=307959 RepID=A0A673JKE8_9TELE